MKYNRNIGAKKYSSLQEIYDSVNDDPKRPGFQIVYLDRQGDGQKVGDWYHYLSKAGYNVDHDVTIKTVTVDMIRYSVLIIAATPEEATALKICF